MPIPQTIRSIYLQQTTLLLTTTTATAGQVPGRTALYHHPHPVSTYSYTKILLHNSHFYDLKWTGGQC